MEPGTAVGSPCCSSIGKQRKIAKGWTLSDKRNAARALARAALCRDPEANLRRGHVMQGRHYKKSYHQE